MKQCLFQECNTVSTLLYKRELITAMSQSRCRTDNVGAARTNWFEKSISRDHSTGKTSKVPLSPHRNERLGNEISDLFTRMSLSDVSIDISTLESIIEEMKSQSLNQLTLRDFLMRMDILSNKKENEHPDANKARTFKSEDSESSPLPFEDAEKDSSLSSSVDSSWTSAHTDSPPLQFSFKTPQKIFTFTHSPSMSSNRKASTGGVKSAVDRSESLFADPPADAPPPPPPPPPAAPRISKFLFPEEVPSMPPMQPEPAGDTAGLEEPSTYLTDRGVSGGAGGQTCSFSLGSKGSSKGGGRTGGAKGKAKGLKAFRKAAVPPAPVRPSQEKVDKAHMSSTAAPFFPSAGSSTGTKEAATSPPQSQESPQSPFKAPPPAFVFASKTGCMSVGSTDNDMEDGCVSPEVQAFKGPFSSRPTSADDEKAKPGAVPVGFKAFSLFKNAGAGQGGASHGKKKPGMSSATRKKRGGLKQASSTSVKELDNLFANIKVDQPMGSPLKEGERGGGGGPSRQVDENGEEVGAHEEEDEDVGGAPGKTSAAIPAQKVCKMTLTKCVLVMPANQSDLIPDPDVYSSHCCNHYRNLKRLTRAWQPSPICSRQRVRKCTCCSATTGKYLSALPCSRV